MTLNTSEPLRHLPFLGGAPWWLFAVPFYTEMGAQCMLCISVFGHVAWHNASAVVLNSSCHITLTVYGTSSMPGHSLA